MVSLTGGRVDVDVEVDVEVALPLGEGVGAGVVPATVWVITDGDRLTVGLALFPEVRTTYQ